MSENKNKWQEISDILSSERDEIYDYFGGTTKRTDDAAGPVELSSDELDLPEPPQPQVELETNEPETAEPESVEPVASEPEAVEPEMAMEQQTDDLLDSTQPTEPVETAAAAAGADSGQDDSDDYSFPTLEDLDVEPEPPRPRKKPKRRSEKTTQPAAAPEIPAEPVSETQDSESSPQPISDDAIGGHWNDLAAELGITSNDLDVDAPEEELEEIMDEAIDSQQPAEPETFEPVQLPEDLSAVSSLFELHETSESEEVLSSMFVPSGDETLDDEVEPEERVVDDIVVDTDEEFIEFNVQDLEDDDSESSDRRRKRKRKRVSSKESDSESGDEPESRRRRRERPKRRQESDDQSPRPAKSESDDVVRDEKRRRRRSKSRSRDDREENVTEESRDTKVSSGSSKKSKKNVPTWSEAINSIVDGNMLQRKKSSGQRRRRGNRNN